MIKNRMNLNLFLILIVLSLFEPDFFRSNMTVYIADFFFLYFVFLLMFTFLMIGKNCKYHNSKENYIFLISFLITIIQVYIYKFEFKIFADLFKILKFVIPLYYLNSLHVETKNYIYDKVVRILKIYIITTFIFVLVQRIYPSFPIFKFYAQSIHHLNTVGKRSFGLIGNVTHAGYIMGLISLYFLKIKKYNYFTLSIINLFYHTNRSSILVTSLIILYLLVNTIDKKSSYYLFYSGIFLFISILQNHIILILNKFLGMIETLYNLRTFTHRLDVLLYTIDQMIDSPAKFLFLGLPDKSLWLKKILSFDNNILLLINRFGIIFTILFYIYLYKLSKKNKSLIIFTYIILTSLTMVNTYHLRFTVISCYFLLMYDYKKEYK